MATLVLQTVGAALGGPIGGAVGALIGYTLDHTLFTPRAARGPRLNGLAVQGSGYGAALPRLFGTMRVAGTVIWSTDLIERREEAGGGKGRGSTTHYSYSASFAVALSARPIQRVGRIWAEGNLLRGAAGDWKSPIAGFRLHLGDEGQAPDPLIAAAQGLDATPAYRGLAYAVFEGLELGAFGNRIPSLGFEVIADAAPVSVGEIAAALSDGAIRGGPGERLTGFAAEGDSVRGALEALAEALPIALGEDAQGLVLLDEDAPARPIDPLALGGHGGTRAAPRLEIERRGEGLLTEALTLMHYDPARDFQPGAQTARRGAAGRRGGTVALAAALPAAAARALAEARLARDAAARETARVTLSAAGLAVPVGAILRLPDLAGRWRVRERRFEEWVVTLACTRLPGAAPPPPPASPGAPVIEPDRLSGRTRLALLDLPLAEAAPRDEPALLIAARGDGAGWRGAMLIGSRDEGQGWEAIGATAPPAVIGTAETALAPGGALLVDRRATLVVRLPGETALAGDDRLGWSAARTLMLVGDELLQFGTATALGDGRFRLSTLLRGRRGTEWAMALHQPGERVVLIEPTSLRRWPLPLAALGTRLRVSASGVGDAEPAEAALRFMGAALAPPAPVAGRMRRRGAGVRIEWVRRSRQGWDWRDGGEAPLGEERERYRVTVEGAPPHETDRPWLELAAARPGLSVTIEQLGTVAASPPLRLVLP
ncbi:GTA baseplate fiber-binding domain-containing protein [Sphingomonas morindae]|uniref:Phage tail protein n=1 Tax=Sphingomonas morindae TaxID=1541170 RepID=A0ABY4X3M7_9SPHN|nr:phage tail protein [Sphingomonas morindae]USI71479.1 phage tail protein [Sphingomonas morindae]